MSETLQQQRPDEIEARPGEERPWGRYVVTALHRGADGEAWEKDVIIAPGKILSLQSHDLREEIWRVVSGTLRVIIDGVESTLAAGEQITVPRAAVHTMGNLTAAPVIVHETGRGICREEDIVRYADMAGRLCVEDGRQAVRDSLALYRRLLQEIGA